MGDDAVTHARILSPISIGHHPSRLGDAKESTVNEKRRLLTELVNDIHRKNSCDKNRKDDFLRKLGDRFSPPIGVELVKKKSYHPELRTDAPDDPSGKMDIRVFPKDSPGNQHKMELIHLNRTCTSVNLMAPTLSPAAQVRMSSSDANLTDEEKVHKVRHQVSFAHPAPSVFRGNPSFECEDLLHSLKRSSALQGALVPNQYEKQDEDNDPFMADYEDFLDDGGPEEVDQEQDSFDFFSHSANMSPDGDLDYLEVRPSLASTQLNELRGPN